MYGEDRPQLAIHANKNGDLSLGRRSGIVTYMKKTKNISTTQWHILLIIYENTIVEITYSRKLIQGREGLKKGKAVVYKIPVISLTMIAVLPDSANTRHSKLPLLLWRE